MELVLVVALLGLLAAVGAPRFFERRSLDERHFAGDVTAALRQARRVAVATGCPVETRFDAGSVRLAQLNGCAGNTYGTPVADPGTGAANYQRAAPPNVALASNVDPLRFDSLGRALDAAGVVRNANVTVGTLVVSVVGDTGLVRAP